MATQIGNMVAKVSMDQTGFQQGISKLNRELRVVQSEFKASSAQLGGFGKSTEGLKLKTDSLTKQLDIQKQRVQALEGAYKKSVESKGADAKATQNLEIRLNNARAQMARTESDLRKTTAELEKQSSSWYKLSQSCAEAGDKLKSAGDRLAGVGKNLSMKITAPILGIGAAAAKIGMDFEQSMSKVKAMSGATSEEMQDLEKAARDAGASTSKSAKDAADALGYMALAGWDAATSMEGLMPVLRLSEAGNIDLARASSLVTDSMSAMGLTTQELQKYLDIVAQTARSSNTDIDQMALAYLGVGGTLRGLNVDLEESALALGFLANAGVKGSEAGNALNAVLINLTAPTGRAKQALDKLSFSAFDSQDKFKGLENVLFELREKLAGMSEEQRNMMLAMIGGKEHVKDLNALLNGLEDSYDELKASISDADGALEDVAATMAENNKGSLTALKSALEEVALKIYDVLRPAIAQLIEILQNFVNMLNGLSPEMQRAIVIIAGLAAAIGPLLLLLSGIILSVGMVTAAFGGLVAAVGAAGGVVGVFSGVLAALTSPITLVVAGVAALTAVVIALYRNWETIWEGVTSITSSAVEKISDVVSSMGEVLEVVWEKVGTGVTVIAASIAGLLLPKYIALAAQSVATAAKVVASWVKMAAGSTASATVQAVKAIPMVLKQLAVLVVGAARTAARVVASWATMAAKALFNAARMAAAWIIAMGPVAWVGAAIAGLAALIASKTGGMAKAVEAAKDKILKAFRAIADTFDKLKAKLRGKKDKKVALGAEQAEKDAKKEVEDSFKDLELDIDAGNYAVDGMVPSFDNLGSAASGAGSKMKEAAEKAKTAWTGTAEALKNALSTLQTQHETEMIKAEMAGDKVAVLRLKHSQLNMELEKQKQVVAATRTEVDKAIAAGVLEGETKEDLAKRVDELNKKLVDEEKAQASLEKQMYDTSESIKAQGNAAKDLVNELKKVAETYQTDMAKALEDYQAKVKDTNDKLREDTEKLQRDLESKLDDIRAEGADRERQVTEQFQRELENRTRALTNFVGLFDELTTREVSGDTLLRNLEGQVTAFDDWQESIATLAARGIDEGLLQELREMGPKAGPEIAALNTLTDEQLTQYVTLWKQKQEQAKKEATTQLAQQRQEMNGQLSAIRQDTQNQLEQQRREMAQKLQEMQAKAKEELEKYKQDWEKKNEEIRKNTEKNIKDIHDKFNDLVGKSSGYGVSLMENFMDGIDSMMPALIARLESMARLIDSYMPHSPAKRGPLKRINEWGPALVGTFAEGIKRSLPSLENVTARMAMLSPGVLQPAIANSYSTSNVNYNQGGNTINITVQDGEDLLRTLHKLGVRIP